VTFTILTIEDNALQDLTFDASEFTGTLLTATITVGANNDNGNEHTVILGESDATITLTDRSTTNAGDDDNDFFVFEFAGDDIGDVSIDEFVANALVDGTDNTKPNNHDVLDLSEFGITGLADLDLAVGGGDLEITAGDGEFEGTITLLGVGATGDVTADNFEFAA